MTKSRYRVRRDATISLKSFFFFLDEDGEHGPHLSTRDLFHEPRNPGALYWFASIRFLVCWYRHCVWTGLNWYKSPSLFLCGSNTTQGPMKFDIYFYFLRIDSATRKVGGNASGCTIAYYTTHTKNPIFFLAIVAPSGEQQLLWHTQYRVKLSLGFSSSL